MLQGHPVIPPVPSPEVVTVVSSGPPAWFLPVIVLIGIGVLMAAVVLVRPVLRAWANRIEGRTAADEALLEEVHSLRERVAELEANNAQLLELEERLDFAERLLAKGRDDVRQVNS